jgi:hypothetical protein
MADDALVVGGDARREEGLRQAGVDRADEFEDLLSEGGLTVEELVGLEGLASVLSAGPLRERAEDLSDDQRAGVRALVDELRGDRSVVDLSAHMLAVCRA